MSPTTTIKQSEGFAVPLQNMEQDKIENKKAKPSLSKEWRGRQIYEAKTTFPSLVFSITMTTIMILAGALLFSARPIIGGLLIALGIKVGYELDFMISRYPVADPSISMSQLTLSSL